MSMNNIRDHYDAAFMEAFDREYREAELQPKVIELPEGKYQFLVTEVKITDRNNLTYDGLQPDQYFEHTLQITLKVISDKCNGFLTNKFHGLCLGNVKRIKADLSAMGHEFEGLEKLFDDIEAGTMIGLIIDGKVTKKTGKNDNVYTNVWLDRCVGRKQMEEAKGYTPVEDDDDIPWG